MPKLLNSSRPVTKEGVANRILKFVGSKRFLWLTFGWFIIETLYIAAVSRRGVSPDENYHIRLVELFTSNGWLPSIHNQSGYYDLGEVTKLPFFLYHYLLSLPNHLFHYSIHEVFYLRLINIGMAVASLLMMISLATKLHITNLARNVSIFLMANTLMFVFLAASVSYDNFFVPLVLGSMLLMLEFIKMPTLVNSLGLGCCLMAGLLTVTNFLPIAFAVTILGFTGALIGYRRKQFDFGGFWPQKIWQAIGLAIMFIVLSVMFSQRYIGNILRYGTYSPSCERVIKLEQCQQSSIYVRNQHISQLPARPGMLTSPPKYLVKWGLQMDQRVFGIFGHLRFNAPLTFIYITGIWFGLGLIATLMRWRDWRSETVYLILVSVFYVVVLVGHNYLDYRHTGHIDLAVQGRYIFGLLPIIYLVFNQYLLTLKRVSLRALLAILLLIGFFASSLPTYILKTDGANWHTGNAQRLNHNISQYLRKL